MTEGEQSQDEAFRSEIEAVIEEDDIEEVLGATIEIALGSSDPIWATECLIRLAQHPDTDVRGNAMIGFAHLAGRFEDFEKEKALPVLEAGLQDLKPHVREQAEAALGELKD